MGDFTLFNFPVSVGTMLYQATIFTILVYVLHKLFLQKIIAVLDKRRELIVSQLETTDQLKREAKEKLNEQIYVLERAKAEASAIRKNSEEEAKHIIKKAKDDAKRIRAEAFKENLHRHMKGA